MCWIKKICFVLGIILCSSCSTPRSLIGEWKAVGGGGVGGKIVFNEDHTVKADYNFDPVVKELGHYSGTYKLDGSMLTITWTDLKMENTPLAGQIAAKEVLHKPQSGTLDWEASNAVDWLSNSGKTMLRR